MKLLAEGIFGGYPRSGSESDPRGLLAIDTSLSHFRGHSGLESQVSVLGDFSVSFLHWHLFCVILRW